MTAPQVPPTKSTVPVKRTASKSGRLESIPLLTPRVRVVQDLLCRWVPGTTNMITLKISGESGGELIIELTSRRLSHIFGKEVMSELYLKGRARISATVKQMALLREAEGHFLLP